MARTKQQHRDALRRKNILLGGYDSLIAGGRNEDDLLALTARDLVNQIIAHLPDNSNERVLLERYVANLTRRQRNAPGRPLDYWYNDSRKSIRAHVAPAANGNQGNGGNGAANVLPRFILLGALLAFFCAALGSYSLRDSCVHLTVVEGSSNNAMYAGWWRNVSMSMCLLLGQGGNTTHEGGGNILGTSPDFDTISGEGEGAGGSASTSTEESRDKSINTTAGQSNFSSATGGGIACHSHQSGDEGNTTHEGGGGYGSTQEGSDISGAVGSVAPTIAGEGSIDFDACNATSDKAGSNATSSKNSGAENICNATAPAIGNSIFTSTSGGGTANHFQSAQGQGDNTTHEGGENILGTSPDFDTISGAGEGAGGSASTPTEKTRDISTNTTAGQSNCTTPSCQPSSQGPSTGDVSEGALDNGNGGDQSEFDKLHLHQVVASQNYELARLRKILWATAVIIIALLFLLCYNLRQKSAERIVSQQRFDQLVLCHRTIQHAGATETLLRAIITRLGDENRTLQNSLEEAQAQLTRLRPPFFFRNEYESAADECKDDSSYSSHLSHGSSNEERRNDEAYSIFASTSSSTHHPTQSSDSSIDTSSEGNISTPPKPTIETLASEVRELREIVDDNSEESVVDSDDDQGENCLLKKLKRRIEEESDRGDDNQSTVNQLVNDVAGLLIDIENINYLLNMLLDRPAGEETLAIMRRQRSRIDTFQRERNAEFRYVQLERAAAMERLNHNVYQSSDEESNDEMMIEQLNRNVYQFSDEESNDD